MKVIRSSINPESDSDNIYDPPDVDFELGGTDPELIYIKLSNPKRTLKLDLDAVRRIVRQLD